MATHRKEWLKAFGQAVRELRTRIGISQEALGPKCGLDRTYVSGIERGIRNPTLLVIVRLAEGLETTPSELMRLAQKRLGDE